MESQIYGYYYVTTDCLSNKWKTNEIEQFILAYGGFEQKGCGDFRHKSLFCTIQLMNINSYTSWNSKDYSKKDTNYISIIASKKPIAAIKEFFRDLEVFLGWHICEEKDDTL